MTSPNTLWLIDDDPALRLILEDTFIDAGLNVVVFSGAKGAWAKLNDILHGHESVTDLPEVILTDIRMPMMDGLSFSEWVHKNFPELPIVIMTAHSDLKSAVDSYQTGAFEYLPKPFDLDDAVAVINKAIRPKTMTAEMSDTTSTVNTNDHTTDSMSVSDSSSPVVEENIETVAKSVKSTSAAATKSTKASRPKASHATSLPEPNYIGKNNPDNTPQDAKDKYSQQKPTKSSQQKTNSEGNATRIIGQSQAMQTVFRAIGRLSQSPITVLITGESGTGKELVAAALHEHSPRRNKPFIALNMAAIPHDLIESELFGHEKGAFTGASTQRQGRFEQANGGTLFLDEIGDMPFSTQTRLLRVLANGEFFRVGGQKPIQVDVRIVAATHQNLENLVKEGKFREDLFYRLNVIRLPLPPLRQRRDDIPELVEFFMGRAAIEMNAKQKQISADALQLMQAFDWSGNVRQLENACRWITVMATGDMVMIDDLPPELTEFARYYLTGGGPSNQPQGQSNQLSDNYNTHSTIATQGMPNNYGFNTSNHSMNNNVHGSGFNTPNTFDQRSQGVINNDYSNVTQGSSGYTNPSYSQNEPGHNEPPGATHQNTAAMHQRSPTNPASPYLEPNGTVLSRSNTMNKGAIGVPSTSSQMYIQANEGLSWQQKLQTWATEALRAGETEILQLATPEFEKVLVTVALKHTKGRKGDAADILGWGRNTLTRKIKLLGLND